MEQAPKSVRISIPKFWGFQFLNFEDILAKIMI